MELFSSSTSIPITPEWIYTKIKLMQCVDPLCELHPANTIDLPSSIHPEQVIALLKNMQKVANGKYSGQDIDYFYALNDVSIRRITAIGYLNKAHKLRNLAASYPLKNHVSGKKVNSMAVKRYIDHFLHKSDCGILLRSIKTLKDAAIKNKQNAQNCSYGNDRAIINSHTLVETGSAQDISMLKSIFERATTDAQALANKLEIYITMKNFHTKKQLALLNKFSHCFSVDSQAIN